MDKEAMTDKELIEQARSIAVEEARTAIVTRKEKIDERTKHKNGYLDDIDSSKRELSYAKDNYKCVVRDIKKLQSEVKALERVIDSGGKKRFVPRVPRPARQSPGCIV